MQVVGNTRDNVGQLSTIIVELTVTSTGVDWDIGGESGLGARPGIDTEINCLARLEPGGPIHLLCTDPTRLTVL